MYVPGPDESMIRDAPKPLEFSPFADMQVELTERRAMIEREIQQLSAIVGRMLARRQRDD